MSFFKGKYFLNFFFFYQFNISIKKKDSGFYNCAADWENLIKTFEMLNFQIEKWENNDFHNYEKNLRKLKENLDDLGCLFFILMSKSKKDMFKLIECRNRNCKIPKCKNKNYI